MAIGTILIAVAVLLAVAVALFILKHMLRAALMIGAVAFVAFGGWSVFGGADDTGDQPVHDCPSCTSPAEPGRDWSEVGEQAISVLNDFSGYTPEQLQRGELP